MGQRVRVDPPVLLLYLGSAAIACRNAPEPVMPVGARPATLAEVAPWVTATVPTAHQVYRFKWLLRDERGSAGGHGAVRVAPPDSLRFDVAGPFGSGGASAVVIGDRALWTDPADAIARLVPNYPLMWAMFGVARMPPESVTVRALSTSSAQAWQFAGARDTVAYARSPGDAGRLAWTRASEAITELEEASQVENAMTPEVLFWLSVALFLERKDTKRMYEVWEELTARYPSSPWAHRTYSPPAY